MDRGDKARADAAQHAGDAGRIRAHGARANAIFALKAGLLTASRFLRDRRRGAPLKYPRGHALRDAPVIAAIDGALWNADDNPLNWRLTAGKVHNLRIAAAAVDGIEIPPHGTFSFWAHLGRPGRSRGFVRGRAVRDGCIVPSVAGGLCQLSNALYAAALDAGFDIVERHRHTAALKGSLAEQDRDATLKWNYLDLRFRAEQPFRIEAELSDTQLHVRLRGVRQANANSSNASASNTSPATTGRALPPVVRAASPLRDCYSCGQTACASHRVVAPLPRPSVAFLLDERWPEYDNYLRQTAQAGDLFLCPVDRRVIRRQSYAWNLPPAGRVLSFTLQTLGRAWAVRRTAGKGGKALQSTLIAHDRSLARRYMRRIPPECTHLVVAQNLLPWLWQAGALGGRTFDVMMYRLPLDTLQQSLDTGFARNPASSTLNDFRAPPALVGAESQALARARRIITPHAAIAALFADRAVRLNWAVPTVPPRPAMKSGKVLLAAPPLGRKGVYEVERLAQELGLSVIALNGASEGQGVTPSIARATNIPFEEIALVLLPAYVEHKPRLALRAAAMGIPVIASEACGLHGVPGVVSVPTGDYQALKQATIDCLEANLRTDTH